MLVNSESMKCIFALAEAQAINLNSHYLALKWFQTLAKISRLHGKLHIQYTTLKNNKLGFKYDRQLFHLRWSLFCCR